MTFTAVLLFALTELFLSMSPGPAVFLVISQGIRVGFRRSLAGTLGILAGNATYFALSALGIGAILVASQTLFQIIKWAGALYLVGLGVKLIYDSFTAEPASPAEPVQIRRRHLFRQGLTMQLANPQAILYFVAILPQFMDVNGAPARQLLILGIISVFVELPVLILYGWLAEKGGGLLRQSRFGRWLDRVAGSFLLAAGIRLALNRAR